jgi:transposase InsO family protein
LRRNGRIVPPAGGAAATDRFEKEAPNLLWQMDFKGWVTLTDATRCHPLTVVDDHSRYLLCLQACADQQSGTVRAHLEATFRRLGLPDAMFVDNGSPWGGARGSAGHDLACGC